jgi:hypothetical protein
LNRTYSAQRVRLLLILSRFVSGFDFVIDGANFARDDCPVALCGSIVNHPPPSLPPNTAFLQMRTPISSPLLSMRPAPVSFDPAALYYPATTEYPSDDDVPIVAMVTICPVNSAVFFVLCIFI